MRLKKLLAASLALMCLCGSMVGCEKKQESSSENKNVINVTCGEYYLDGDKDKRCINVIDENNLQFTNCDIKAFVDEMMECDKDAYPEETFIQIKKEINENLSAPINYNEVDYRKNTNNEIYILLSKTSGGMMCFKYASDSQGTSLVFGNNDNIQEYILSE